MAAVDIAQVDQKTSHNLNEFSEHLGLMFQIKDDLLDVYGDEKIGKAVGSDESNNKKYLCFLIRQKRVLKTNWNIIRIKLWNV